MKNCLEVGVQNGLEREEIASKEIKLGHNRYKVEKDLNEQCSLTYLAAFTKDNYKSGIVSTGNAVVKKKEKRQNLLLELAV